MDRPRSDDPRDPPHVSRKHCELIVEPPSVLVRDLDSAYGTSINDRLLGCRATPAVALGRLFDGEVAGTWRFEKGRVKLEPFGRLSKSTQAELEEEAERLAAFHA